MYLNHVYIRSIELFCLSFLGIKGFVFKREMNAQCSYIIFTYMYSMFLMTYSNNGDKL